MVRKPSQLRQVAGEAARERGGSRRRSSAAVAAVGAAVLLLAGCGGGGGEATEVADSSAPETPAPEVTEDPNAIQRSLVGLHIEGAEGGAWASAPFGALRLWDNGTGWSQIELAKGEFKWDNLEGVLENAASKGMEDILYVLGTTRSGLPKRSTRRTIRNQVRPALPPISTTGTSG